MNVVGTDFLLSTKINSGWAMEIYMVYKCIKLEDSPKQRFNLYFIGVIFCGTMLKRFNKRKI